MKRVFKILLSGLIAITLVSCFKNENKNINENEKLEATLICPDGLPAIAISNLIDNAIKYNEKNTTLSVMSRKFNDRIEIRIFDDGRGINEEIRDKIFEAFVREDKARSSSTEGAGLGLAITKAIIEKHSGSIKLLDNTKGTEYKIILNI